MGRAGAGVRGSHLVQPGAQAVLERGVFMAA